MLESRYKSCIVALDGRTLVMNRDKQIELMLAAQARQRVAAEELVKSAAYQEMIRKYDAEAYAEDLKRA